MGSRLFLLYLIVGIIINLFMMIVKILYFLQPGLSTLNYNCTYSMMNPQTSNSGFRQIIEGALAKVVRRYKEESEQFQIYLSNFEVSLNLEPLFASLYENRIDLNLTPTDISQILTLLGQNDSFKEKFGMPYYLLWFEFALISAGKFKQRIKKEALLEFPKDKSKHIQALQQICLAYLETKMIDCEKKILNKLQSQSNQKLFQQFLQIDRQNSKIKPMSIIKSYDKKQVESSLEPQKLSVVYTGVLQNIVRKIGVVSKIQDFEKVRENLKDYFNQILEMPQTLQNEVISISLKQVLLNVLGVDIIKNHCRLNDQSKETIKNGFQLFVEFFRLEDIIVRCAKRQFEFERLLQQFKKLLINGYSLMWYMPIFNRSIISLLIAQSIKVPGRLDFLIDCINKYPPNLNAKIFNVDNRAFLEQILIQLPQSDQFNRLIKNCIVKLTYKQKVSINVELPSGKTYESMLRNRGIQGRQIQDLSIIQENHIKVYIYDNRSQERQTIYLSAEHIIQIIEKTKDARFYENITLDDRRYQLTFSMNNKQSTAKFESGRHGKLQRSICFEGKCNINVLEISEAIKGFSWEILDVSTWKYTEFSQNECQEINNKLFNARKGTEKITIKMAKYNTMFEINCQTLEVKSVVQQQSQSSLKQIGYIVYAPSHKSKSQIQDVSIPPQEEQILYKPNQAEEEQPQIISFETTFKFLGVFQQFFDNTNGYRVDQDFSIRTVKKQCIEYFKTWEQITIYRQIDRHLSQPQPQPQKNRKNPNKIVINKKQYIEIAREFGLLQSKLNNKIQHSIDEKSSQLQILNLNDQVQALQFFTALLQYLHLKVKDSSSKRQYSLQVSKDQLKALDLLKPSEVKIIKDGTNLIVEASKEQKEKLVELMNSLDEVQQFTYQHSQAYKLMKEVYGNDLKEMKVTEIEIGQQFFKVKMRVRDVAQFNKRLQECLQTILQAPGQTRQIIKKSQSQFLHIYRSQMLKVEPQISVSKFNDDILIEYNIPLQSRVKQAFQRIQELKNKEFFDFLKKSSDQHILKNIPHNLVYALKDKVLIILEKAAKMGLKPKIDLTLMKEDQFSLKAEQISKEQQQLFNKSMLAFQKRYKELLKLKQLINDTNKFINGEINKLPKGKVSITVRKDLQDFTKFVRAQLIKIIDEVNKEKHSQLSVEFQKFVKNDDLEKTFTSKQAEQSKKQIEGRIAKLNYFSDYVSEFIDRLCLQLKSDPKKTLKDRLNQQMGKIIQEISAKKQLQTSDIERYFKSLNILGKIYFGEQLPITAHLAEFKDKLENNDVVMVKVGTGSGKSTVLPPYLIGLGYEKVVVTQPRRLPCREIYKRINSVFGTGVSGYEVGDGKKDANNRLLYVTDGLLKMRAIFKIEVLDQIDVLMIDEIHERSANIDILLLLLYSYYKQAKRTLKLVLCSATIDTRIGDMMKEAGLRVDTFFTEVKRHPVTQHPIAAGTIIEKIVELSTKLKQDEQMLVFFPGVKEVNDTVAILRSKFSRVAFPITANQSPKDQQLFLETGSIFIATAIAQTSLTFRKLKYVVDSRLSRWRTFNSELELMETEEIFSSNSSIRQRIGRLGRTCPGEYYYFEYNSYDYKNNQEHNPTELEKMDFTNYLFELLLREGASFDSTTMIMRKLNHNQAQFDKKIEYSKKILKDLGILKSNVSLQNSARNLFDFGNLGNPQHNYALYLGSISNCLIDVIFLVSFFMVASNVSGEILKYIKGLYQGGDIKVIHSFISKIAQQIQLQTIKQTQIKAQMIKICKNIANKSWFNVVCRIMIKVKQLFRNCHNFVPSIDWNEVIKVLVGAYGNKIFFNQSLFGGNRNNFEKFRSNYEFSFQLKQERKVIYKMDMNSAIYKKDDLPMLILSINCVISPQDECILSICEQIAKDTIVEPIQVTIIGTDCPQKYIFGGQIVKQEDLFQKLQLSIKSNFKRVKVNMTFPVMTVTGVFKEVSEAFRVQIEPKRRNEEVKLSLRVILEEAISNRLQRVKKDPMMPTIEPELTRSLLQKLNNYDFKTMFQTTKFEMFNNFGVDIEWEANVYDVCLTAKKIKNIHVAKLLDKLQSFFRWFADSQMICKEEFKVKPRHLQQGPFLNRETKEKIVERINNIVDSRIEPYVLKGWVNGRVVSAKHPRTARMIAVCWVLTNIFDCVIKGGFVRDWVVNGEQVLPNGNLSKLLQISPRNGFLEVVDDTVTPSDIDAELSSFVLFDEERFKKEMAKLGIETKIEEDGWRRHVIFDEGSITGGFTADLIEPYTSMCHDSYDFDVNTLYLKKGNINSIGQKIPLEFEEKSKMRKIQIQEIIANCRKKEMKKLKQNMPPYRQIKFRNRGWKIIQSEVYIPNIYRSYHTQVSPIPPTEIQRISPVFYHQMVVNRRVKIIKIQSLRNKSWDDSFEATEHWIITEIEQGLRSNNPLNYHSNTNSNNKMLFHGSKVIGTKGIKEFAFDSRFFNSTGFYGRGAYFADNPEVSNRYTEKNQDGYRQMFVVKVALGKQQVLKVAANDKLGPSKGYHSILGQAGPNNQYIIERWGQAKPMYLITYAYQ